MFAPTNALRRALQKGIAESITVQQRPTVSVENRPFPGEK
jgi:hypothetical protein